MRLRVIVIVRTLVAIGKSGIQQVGSGSAGHGPQTDECASGWNSVENLRRIVGSEECQCLLSLAVSFAMPT